MNQPIDSIRKLLTAYNPIKRGHIGPQEFSWVVVQWLALIVPESRSWFYNKEMIIFFLLSGMHVSVMK